MTKHRALGKGRCYTERGGKKSQDKELPHCKSQSHSLGSGRELLRLCRGKIFKLRSAQKGGVRLVKRRCRDFRERVTFHGTEGMDKS